MKVYTVRMNGLKVKDFASQKEANDFLLKFIQVQELQKTQLEFIDAAVLKSDLLEANLVIKYIMELPNA